MCHWDINTRRVTHMITNASSSHFHDRTAVWGGAETGLLSLRLSVFQGSSWGYFLLAHGCPIEKVTLWDGLFYSTSWSKNRRGCCEMQSFCPNWKSNSVLWVQTPVCYPLSYRFTPWQMHICDVSMWRSWPKKHTNTCKYIFVMLMTNADFLSTFADSWRTHQLSLTGCLSCGQPSLYDWNWVVFAHASNCGTVSTNTYGIAR